jgi:predicted ribosome quality control (RQC) complex YloA/Tae2 family protein
MSIKIILDYRKSIDENAGTYFDKSKKAKKKIEGIKIALAKFEKDKLSLEKKKHKLEQKVVAQPKKTTHWYEKFRWFISSEGILLVGGRDVTQNEILIKKHVEKNDLIFHTELAGSPFFVAKITDTPAGPATHEEAAAATASYSKAWKLGLGSAEMIRGKREYFHPSLGLAMGVVGGNLICGPQNAIAHQTKTYVIISQGDSKASDAAKKIKKDLEYSGHLDDIIRFLPSGKVNVRKRDRKR